MSMDLIGKQLGRFRITKKLGAGAMGAVYRATDVKTGIDVAIKVVDTIGEPNPTVLRRFEREIEHLSQFRHRNIVKIYGSSVVEGIRFYAMELVDGKNLQELLEQRGRLSFQKVVAYGMQVCEALQEIHAVGIVHRDLKPANLMVTDDHRVKLTDFGIAKDLSSTSTQLTQDNHTVGTVAYMSPEQLAGRDLTRRSDLYSLGVTLYRMSTGRLPFSGDTMYEYINDRMKSKIVMPSLLVSDLPIEFDALIADLLHPEPERRPMDAYVVMQRLLDLQKIGQGGKTEDPATMKTRQVRVEEALAETKVTGTQKKKNLFRSVTGLFSRDDLEVTRSGKSKKRKQKEATSFFDSPAFYGILLAAVLGLIGYAFMPLGPDALLERGKELAKTDIETAWEKFFTPLQKRYPTFGKLNELAKYDDELLRQRAQGRSTKFQLVGLPIDASEAEKRFYQAESTMRRLDDKVKALEQFKAVYETFKDDKAARGIALLAEDRIVKLSQEVANSPEAQSKRQIIEKKISEAKGLLTDRKLRAGYGLLEDLLNVYGKDQDVADLIQQVKELLAGDSEKNAGKEANGAKPNDAGKKDDVTPNDSSASAKKKSATNGAPKDDAKGDPPLTKEDESPTGKSASPKPEKEGDDAPPPRKEGKSQQNPRDPTEPPG